MAMTMKKVRDPKAENYIPVLKCRRKSCGYNWVPRSGKVPVECPACKSRHWNKEQEG